MGKRLSTEEFKRRANLIHGYKYDYSNVDYTYYNDKVSIICPKHGEFLQRAHDHLDGSGCPKCAKLRSKAEIRLSEFIEGLGFHVINSDRTILDGKEIDIYVPSSRIAIEFNGLRYHSSLFRGYPEMHRFKYESCLNKNGGIRLLQFYEDEWFSDRSEIFKKTSDALFGRDIQSFNENKPSIVVVDLDYGVGVDLNKIGYELVNDSGPVPYEVVNNYKAKRRIGENEEFDSSEIPVIWTSGYQTWSLKNIPN